MMKKSWVLFFFITILIAILLIASCREKVFDIDESKTQQVKYEDLPEKVKKCFELYDTTNVRGGKQLFYSTDSTVEFTYGNSGRSDSWWNEINSNYNHFFIDGVHFRFPGNKGEPFILDENILYYPVNLNWLEKYKKQNYYKVRLPLIK